MGTKAITAIKGDGKAEVATLYRGFDGYPSWYGLKLGEFLMEHEVNELTTADGLKELKNSLVTPKTRGWHDYTYIVRPDKRVTVKRCDGKVLFKGDPGELMAWASEQP